MSEGFLPPHPMDKLRNRTRRLERLLDMEAPNVIIEKEKDLIVRAARELFEAESTESVLTH